MQGKRKGAGEMWGIGVLHTWWANGSCLYGDTILINSLCCRSGGALMGVGRQQKSPALRELPGGINLRLEV